MTTPATQPTQSGNGVPSAASAASQQGGASSAPSAAATGGASTTGASHASASLYVGDLTPDVTEALLFEVFNAVGPVASVRVCRDAATRRSLGYAYVNFHRVDDAERALDTMNFKNIRNRPCRIMWSHRDPSLRKSGQGNIFVNHLARIIDNKQLFDTFSTFGNILSCKVSTNAKRESLGYGFVHYETDESARLAIEKVDGKVIAGERVSVSMFKSKKERGGANKFKYTNVFVKNLPGEYTKEQLNELFTKYGKITASMVNTTKDDKTKAFGFVNFETPEEATAAVEGANGQEVGSLKIYVGRAQKKEEREKELHDRFEQQKLDRQKKYAGVNLYVKNLADETDDQKLSQEFAKFGSIESVKIMRDETTQRSKGFGFVCFLTPEDATKAVTAMNGSMLEGKQLYVALAQRKDVRRAQLEAQWTARAKLGIPQPVQGLPYGANPMMFGGMPRGFQGQQQMYPGQVGGMPRWNPQAGNPMMLGQQRGMPGQINYQLMPVNGGRVPVQGQVGMPNGVQGGRGPRQTRGQGVPQQGGPKMVHGGLPGMPLVPGQQPIRYAENVRNVRTNGPGMPMMMQQQQQPEVVMPLPSEPLTIKALAAAPEEMRKQMIGERLFPLIKIEQPSLAGKITGMLLEMDNGELIHLLESQAALHEKITEAMQVLQAHPEAGNEQPEETDGDKQ